MKTQRLCKLLGIILGFTLVLSACSNGIFPIPSPTVAPSVVPTNTQTPIPTSTNTPIPTSTLTVTPSPTPILFSTTSDTFIFAGPGAEGYEKIAQIAANTQVEPVAKFGDYIQVVWNRGNETFKGFIPGVLLQQQSIDLQELKVEDVPWKVVKTIVSSDKPLETQTNKTDNWTGPTLALNMKFDGPFEMRVSMISKALRSSLNLDGTFPGDPHWAGLKNTELFCGNHILTILFRDGTSKDLLNAGDFPAEKKDNDATQCDFVIRFDKNGKSLELFSLDGNPEGQLKPENFGEFKDGIFPNSKIAEFTLASEPGGSAIVSLLNFAIPPDGVYKAPGK